MMGIARMMASREMTASLRRNSVFLSLVLIVSLATGCDAGGIRKVADALAAQAQGARDKAIGAYDHQELDSRMRAEKVKMNLITTPIRLTAIGID
jgi:hypothetical protein